LQHDGLNDFEASPSMRNGAQLQEMEAESGEEIEMGAPFESTENNGKI
jgi:hypothetical protein